MSSATAHPATRFMDKLSMQQHSVKECCGLLEAYTVDKVQLYWNVLQSWLRIATSCAGCSRIVLPSLLGATVSPVAG